MKSMDMKTVFVPVMIGNLAFASWAIHIIKGVNALLRAPMSGAPRQAQSRAAIRISMKEESQRDFMQTIDCRLPIVVPNQCLPITLRNLCRKTCSGLIESSTTAAFPCLLYTSPSPRD